MFFLRVLRYTGDLRWCDGVLSGSRLSERNGRCFFFPTCQVRVVVFYVSCPASSSFPPDLNCKLRIRVFPAGPQLQALDRSVFPAGPQAQDQSVPRRTPTANSRSQCSPQDLHRKLRIRVFPAGPQLQALDRSVFPAGPQAQDQSVPRRTPNCKL